MLTGVVLGAALATAGGVFAGYKLLNDDDAKIASIATPAANCTDETVTTPRRSQGRASDRRHRARRGSWAAPWARTSATRTSRPPPARPRCGIAGNQVQKKLQERKNLYDHGNALRSHSALRRLSRPNTKRRRRYNLVAKMIYDARVFRGRRLEMLIPPSCSVISVALLEHALFVARPLGASRRGRHLPPHHRRRQPPAHDARPPHDESADEQHGRQQPEQRPEPAYPKASESAEVELNQPEQHRLAGPIRDR